MRGLQRTRPEVIENVTILYDGVFAKPNSSMARLRSRRWPTFSYTCPPTIGAMSNPLDWCSHPFRLQRSPLDHELRDARWSRSG